MKKIYTQPTFEKLSMLANDVITNSFTYQEAGDNLSNDEISFN